MTSLQPTLHLPNEKRTGWSEYISNELLRLIGVKDKLVIRESNNVYLSIGEKIKIPESKLLDLFSIISLEREAKKPKDIHGRFDHSKIEWDISQPEINKFIESLRRELEIELDPTGHFKVIFTHDVDWISGKVWASVLKSFKNLFSKTSSWISLDQVFRKSIFLDTYSEMLSIEKEYNIKTWNFLLSGPTGNKRYSSRYDINWELSRKLIEMISESGNEIGLHGSYYSSEDNLYKVEAERLARAIGNPVIAHRNHYLRFDPVRFYSQLETAGIKYDFSVGFSSKPGFRSGVANPYFPYNCDRSTHSEVIGIPLVYMERSNHLANENETLDSLSMVLEEVKKYNGCVSILFHPESFAIDERWFGFYEKVIKTVINLGADISNDLPVINH